MTETSDRIIDTSLSSLSTLADHSEIVARSRRQKALILMYSSCPEPPTLNAILMLKQYFRDVTLFRNNLYFQKLLSGRAVSLGNWKRD